MANNKIATSLARAMAATHRVSMEASTDAEQGKDAEITDKELDQVNAEASAEVTDPATDETAGATNDDGELPPGDPAAEPTAEEGTATDAVADTTQTPADEATGDTEEVPVDQIQTPAEEEAAALSEEDPAAGAEANAEIEAADLGSDPAAAPAATADAPVEGDVTAPAADGADAIAVDAGAEAAVEPAADVAAPAPAEGVESTGAPEAAEGGDVPAVVSESAPDNSEQTTSEPAEGAQKEASEPSQAADASEAVAEVVEVVEAAAEAQSAEDVLKQVAGINEGLKDLQGTAEFINEQGGVTMESMAMLTLAANAFTHHLGREPISFGVTMESFEDATTRKRVSLEELQDLINELDLSEPELERQALQSIDRMVEGLKAAIPSTRQRLLDVLSIASATDDSREGAQVKIGDGIEGALCIDGAFPQDVSNELQQYAALGETILTVYQEAAVRAAKGASMILNNLDFTSLTSFWEKIGKVVDSVTDPRTNISRTQIERQLPGGVCLFGEANMTPEVPNPVLATLFTYNSNYPPLETAVASKGAANAEATGPALSASKIQLIGKAFNELMCSERIDALLEEGSKLWPEAADAVRHLQENLENAPQEIAQTAGIDFSQLVKFVKTNYALATWPLLNYLSNLVITANAFVLYADRSLKAEAPSEVADVSEVLPAESTIAEPAADPVVDGIPPADPVVDAAADPAGAGDLLLPEGGEEAASADASAEGGELPDAPATDAEAGAEPPAADATDGAEPAPGEQKKDDDELPDPTV